jgi:prepilin-type N-terminal cleavage/methylation domain-containing protein
MISHLNQKGFTLLEVFAAIMIFALGILALTRLQITSLQTNSFSNDLTQATTLAMARMEDLLRLPYTDANLVDRDNDGTAGLDDQPNRPSPNNGPDFALNQDRFTIYWNIADNDPIVNTKRIGLTVTWRDNKNTLHSAIFHTTKADIF